MLGIRYKIVDREFRQAIDGLTGRLANLQKPLKECGLVGLRSFAKTFKAGGRPVRWTPSKRAKLEGGKTLIKTARLLRSITMKVTSRSVIWGTNVKYARIQHLGGRIRKNVTVKKFWRVMTSAFGRSIPAQRVLVRSHQRRMDLTIESRPFLVIQDEDWRVFKRIFADYITGN